MPSKAIVLSIAGHDPSGGAGIHADIETLRALDCQPATVITCLTVQDSANLHRLCPVEAELVSQQAQAVLADYPVKAIKIGLIGTPQIGEAIGQIIRQNPKIPVILDPVLAAGGGAELAGQQLIDTICRSILPHTKIITPNSIEARRLSGKSELSAAANQLLATGCTGVLITGTHEASDEVVNTLYQSTHPPQEQKWPRLANSYHGSGCTLASAVAAGIAQGLSLPEAVARAQEYTWTALSKGWRPGRGQHLPERLFALPRP